MFISLFCLTFIDIYRAGEYIDDFEPLLNVCGDCAVLIASRKALFVDNVIELSSLEDDGWKFLQSVGKIDTKEIDAIKAICTRMENLPLAIKLAGSYIKTRKLSAEEYLRKLRKTPLGLLGKQRPTERQNISSVVALTLADVPLGRMIMSVVGVLAYAPFKKEVIIEALKDTSGQDEIEDTLEDLTANYLLDRGEDGTYEVHHILIHDWAHEHSTVSRDVISRLASYHLSICNHLHESGGWKIDKVNSLHENYHLHMQPVSDEASLPTIHRHLVAIIQKCKNIGLWENALDLAELSDPFIDLISSDTDKATVITTAFNAVFELTEDDEFNAENPRNEQYVRWSIRLGNFEIGRGNTERGSEYLTHADTQIRQIIHNNTHQHEHQRFEQMLGQIERNLGVSNMHDNPKKALDYLEKGLESARMLKDNNGECSALCNLGEVYLRLGKAEDAIDFYEQSIEIAKKSNNSDWRGEMISVGNMGNAYVKLENYEKALQQYEQAKEISSIKNDLQSQVKWLSNLGSINAKLGRLKKAEKNYREAYNIASLQLRDDCLESMLLPKLRDVCAEAGKTTSVVNYNAEIHIIFNKRRRNSNSSYHKRLLQQARRNEGAFDELIALIELGHELRRTDQAQQAIPYYEEALRFAREVYGQQYEGLILQNLGYAHDAIYNRNIAITYYQQALNFARSFKNSRTEAICLHNLAVSYCYLRQMDEAFSHSQQAITIAQKIGDRCLEVETRNGLGDCHRIAGQYTEAVHCHRDALTIAQKIRDHKLEVETRNDLGNCYHDAGQYTEAIHSYREALTIAQGIDSYHLEVKIRMGLGRCYRNIGQYTEATRCHREALIFAQRMGDRYLESSIYGICQ